VNNNSTFTIDPFAGSIGAKVSGLPLDRVFDEAVARIIVNLLSRYQILLFRGQRLGPAQQVSVSRSFGSVETHRFHPGQLVDYPEIFRISNSSGDGHTSVGHYWHCDGFAFSSPTDLVMLNVVEAPSESGETLFVDAYNAWCLLPGDLREQLGNARWMHQSGIWHPFQHQHFLTGRSLLLVNLGRLAAIDGLDTEAVSSVVARLDDYLSGLSGLYAHRWQEGDVILMDNWSVVHRAQPAPPSTRRVVHRSSILKLHSFLRELNSPPLKL
jgi:taurine dioxygenase